MIDFPSMGPRVNDSTNSSPKLFLTKMASLESDDFDDEYEDIIIVGAVVVPSLVDVERRLSLELLRRPGQKAPGPLIVKVSAAE